MNFTFKLAIPGLLSIAFALASSGCASTKETPVAVSELPAAVKTTLDRETAGGTIKESEREVKHGMVVHSFDAEIDGKAYDIAIAEDGHLLSKELEK